jgi:hypothetical protein
LLIRRGDLRTVRKEIQELLDQTIFEFSAEERFVRHHSRLTISHAPRQDLGLQIFRVLLSSNLVDP